MKKSHKRILIYEIIIFLIFILNSFVSNILKEYGTVFFLIIALLSFRLLFGFEKDRHRYTKDIIFEVVVFLIVFFMLYYVFGLIIGFARTDDYISFTGLKNFIMPAAMTVLLKEILRYMIVTKSEGNKTLLVVSILMFIFLDITDAIYYNSFESGYETFIFIALTLLPAISTNIACTYITSKTGYKPLLVYLMVMNLYQYLIPIIPNPNEYIASVVNLILPAALGYRIKVFLQREKDEDVDRNYKKERYWTLIFPAAFIAMVVYFTSGYFKYHAIAIASGSMEPNIHKGDVVIIEKLDGDFDSLEEGQVIAYKYNGVIVVHRLIRISVHNNEYFFYTKGDNNPSEDSYAITEDMVMGVINHKISYIGLPTVWLNE